MSETVSVLIVIPTHQQTRFLGAAIASVSNQTIPVELKVTGDVGPGKRSTASLATRLNAAIAESHADAFAILCSDDILCSGFAERTSRVMARERVDIVYSDCYLLGDSGGHGYALGEWTEANLDRNTVPLITSLCSRAAWERAGGFQDVPFFDWDFWWRCYHSGATAHYLHEFLWYYRRHEGQTSAGENLAANREALLERFAALRAEAKTKEPE